MNRAGIRELEKAMPETSRPSLKMLPIRPPSRMGWPVTIGVIIEIVTLATVMVTLATGQFSLIAYGLAVLGIVTPLALVTWGFWRLARDEARSRAAMRSKEQAKSTKPVQLSHEHPPQAA